MKKILTALLFMFLFACTTGNGAQVISGTFNNVVVRDNTFIGVLRNEPGSITFINNKYL